MRVAAINAMRGKAETPTACEIYRINMPFEFMHSRGGHSMAYFYMDQFVDWYRQEGPAAVAKLVSSVDMIVLPRMVAFGEGYLEALASLISIFRRAGLRVVYECDDDLTNQHRQFQFTDATRIASWCDAVTVTTDALGQMMKKSTGRPYYVLPNMIDPDVWDNPDDRMPRDETIITLSGSPTHYNDWIVLKDVIPEILSRKYDRPVQFWMMAFFPDYLRDVPSVEHGQGLVRVPPMVYTHYAEVIRHSDMVLAPVDPEDGFNLSKSPIKIIEGMGATRWVNGKRAGAACIATNCVVYNKTANGSNARLVKHTPDAWLNEIDLLLRDAEKRSALQIRANDWVWRHHNIKRTWKMWENAYHKIMKQAPNPIIPLEELQ